MARKRRSRVKRLLKLGSMVLPFALPALVLVVWLTGQCGGEDGEPLHILASIDPDGGHTTVFSTIIADGNEAVWICSDGTFLETGETQAPGRTVTWQPGSEQEDSVMVVITTPSVSDTVRFLPSIPDMTPMMAVSAAYHLALLERARSQQLPPGNYMVTATGEGLRNYDGLTIVIVEAPELPRSALGMLPGDTTEISLPLGGVVTATGLDTMEGALDNAGNVHITFEMIIVDEEPVSETEEAEPEESSPEAASGESPEEPASP